MSSFFVEIRYALRTLAKSPGFTLAAALTLALGIGANCAIFSVVDAVLLRSLPYEHPERLVRLVGSNPKRGVTDSGLSYTWFEEMRGPKQSVSGIAVFSNETFNLIEGERPE